MLSEHDLALRREAISGTDVAAILGLIPMRRAVDVCLEKWGEAEAWEGNERTHWGSLLEPVLANEYAQEAGMIAVEPRGTLVHPDRDWHVGTPDRGMYHPERFFSDGETIFKWDPKTDTMIATGIPNRLREKICDAAGISHQEYDNIQTTRRDIIEYLIQNNIRDSNMVCEIIQSYYDTFHIRSE